MNKNKDIYFSLVLAVFNEGKIFEDSISKIVKVLDKLPSWEIIFVEDKSTDGSREVLKKILPTVKNARAIFHSKNQGRGRTVSDGIKDARGEVVGFIDVDLEISPDYIPLFIKEIEKGYDVVVGERQYARNVKAGVRVLASTLYSLIVKVLLNLPIKDTESGYKFFRTKNILPVLNQTQDKGWFWDTEIVALSFYQGLKIHDLPVVFKRRMDKQSTVKIFEDSLEYLKRILVFKKNLLFNSFYPQLISQYRKSFKGLSYLLFKLYFFPLKEMEGKLPKKGVILDLGCGEGLMVHILSMRSPERVLIGVDSDSYRLKIAQSIIGRNENIKFFKANINTYRIPTCSSIIASDFLHHLSFEDQSLLIQKCHKSLQKNGLLLIKEVDRDSIIRQMFSRIADEILYRGHIRGNFRTVKDWTNLLKKTGFKVSSNTTSKLSPFSTVLISATKV